MHNPQPLRRRPTYATPDALRERGSVARAVRLRLLVIAVAFVPDAPVAGEGCYRSFKVRLEVEGRERLLMFGLDRTLTIHGRLSSSAASAWHSVPFYLMDTLGGPTIFGDSGSRSSVATKRLPFCDRLRASVSATWQRL